MHYKKKTATLTPRVAGVAASFETWRGIAVKASAVNIHAERRTPAWPRLYAWLIVALATFAGAGPAYAQRDDAPQSYNIPAGSLGDALNQLAAQSKLQILYPPELVAGKSTKGLSGQYTVEDALRRLLEESDLEWGVVNDTTIVIRRGPSTVPVSSTDKRPELDTVEPPESPAELETVTVTASKRAQALEKVPGSVAALSGNQLEKMHAKDMEDYLKLIPGISLAKGDADMGVPIIRGVGTSTSLPLAGLTSQPTGVFIDDVPFTDAALPQQVPDMNPFDLERVEVLKGPQGTLFGASSLAGAIHYVTHKPDLGVFESKFQGSETAVEDPSDRKPMGALALNIPLGSSAALRGVGLYRQSPGYIDELQRGEKDVNSLRQHAGRLLGKWNITDRLNLSASYFRQFDLQSDTSAVDQPKRLERNSTPEANPTRQTFSIGNVLATYDLGWASLLSSTSRKTKNTFLFRNNDNGFGPGTDGTPNEGGGSSGAGSPGLEDQNAIRVLEAVLDETVRGYSQEFRLVSPESSGNWEWLVGTYFLTEVQKVHQVVPTTEAGEMPLPVPLPPPIPTPIGNVGDSQTATQVLSDLINLKDTEASLFGDVTRRLGERWAVTAGGRLFRTALNSKVVANGFGGVALTEDPNSPSTTPTRKTTLSQIGFNPKISAQFQVIQSVMTYALVSKGFQFGGTQFVTQFPVVEGEIPQTFKTSNLWNFETGTRTEWLDRHLSLDATVFYERWSDLQLTLLTTDPTTTGELRFNFIGNVGRAHTVGGEVGLRAIPFTGLTLSSSLARINAVTDIPFDDPGTQQTLPPGTRLPGTPRFQIANVLAYETRFGGWAPGLTLTHSHIGTSFNDLRGTHKLGGYNTFDARIDLLKSNFAFQPDLSLSVNNIFDKRGISGASGDPSTDRVQFFTFIKPRTAELTLGLRFN